MRFRKSLFLIFNTVHKFCFPFHMCVRTSVVLFTPSIDVFLSLNGTVIPNNGLVNINDIGSTDDTALLCITNRPPSGGGTNSGGNWHAPDWTGVGGTDVPGFDRNRGPMVVRLLRRESETPTEGIYHCAIEDNTLKLEAVNVGLYNSGGGNNRNDLQFFQCDIGTGIVTLSGGVNFTLDSDSQFTLACISTGGPATTVTWTRDSTTVTQGTETVLNDPVTAQYTHTLTVTTEGLYICTVANNNPSSASASITLQGIYCVMCHPVIKIGSLSGPPPPTAVTAVQDGPNSITVTWTPPSLQGDTTGYRISFTGGSDVDIDGGSTNSYTLTGLTNGQTYTISIVATSEHFFSDATSFEITLSKREIGSYSSSKCNPLFQSRLQGRCLCRLAP